MLSSGEKQEGGEKEEVIYKWPKWPCSKLLTELLSGLFVCLHTFGLYSANWKWQPAWPKRFPLETALDIGRTFCCDCPYLNMGTKGENDWPHAAFVRHDVLGWDRTPAPKMSSLLRVALKIPPCLPTSRGERLLSLCPHPHCLSLCWL